MLAEDNPKNLRLMQLILKKAGFELVVCQDGESALRLACREHPDLILLDISLPSMSGLEVAARLRELDEFSHTPIIAVTAHAMKGDKERFLSQGFTGYLAKPIDTRTLVEQLKSWVSG